MNPIQCYTSLEVTHPYRLVGPGNNQSTTAANGLLWQPPGYKATSRGVTTSTTLQVPGLGVGYFAMQNRSGSTIVMGLGVRIPNQFWVAGSWTDATTTFADDTAAAQNTTTADFELETTTNNDGHVILSRYPFNAISYDIGTASVAGAGYDHDFAYSDEIGTTWVTYTTADMHINDFGTVAIPVTGTTIANEALLVWDVPNRWGKSAAGLGTSLPVDYYAWRVRAIDAGTTAAVADSCSIYRIFFLSEAVVDNAMLTQDFGAKDFIMALDHRFPGEFYGDALVALFGTANAGNRVIAQVRGR